jgi:hypothetical protein
MNAAHRLLRYSVGVLVGCAGLGAAWWLITWTLSTLSPAAIAELFSGPGFSILAVIAALGLVYLFGTAAIWMFDAVLKSIQSHKRS